MIIITVVSTTTYYDMHTSVYIYCALFVFPSNISFLVRSIIVPYINPSLFRSCLANKYNGNKKKKSVRFSNHDKAILVRHIINMPHDQIDSCSMNDGNYSSIRSRSIQLVKTIILRIQLSQEIIKNRIISNIDEYQYNDCEQSFD